MGKSTVGFILTLIGGILQGISGLMLLMGGSFLTFMLPGFFTAISILPGLVLLAACGVSIWASTMMNKTNSDLVKKGGIIALISGIVGLNLLVIIGAIVALIQSKD